MNQFDRSLPIMLHRTLDSVMPMFRPIFKEFGLTEQQWRVLRVLWEKDGLGALALADTTLIPGPSLVGVIDRLERNGLVVRRRSTVDRRVVQIFVTAGGKALETTVQPKVDAAYAELEASVTPALWKSLYQAMDAINNRIANKTAN